MNGLLKYLFPFFKHHKWMLIGGFICVLLYNYLKVYSTTVVGQAFNFVEEVIQNNEELHSTFQTAVTQGAWYFTLAIISGIFLFLTRQTIIVMSRKIEYNMKNQIYQHYQELDQSFYKQHSIGDLMNRISEDVGKVRMFLGPSILYGMNLLVTSVTVIYFMLQKNVELTLYCLLPLPIMSIIIYYISARMNTLNHQTQKEQSTLSSMAQETFSGIRVIKCYGKESLMQKLFQKQIEKYRQKVINVAKVEAWFTPCIITLVGLSTILSIYLGGIKVIAGELKIGDIAEFVVFINLLTWPFASLGWITSLTQAAISSQQRISEFLNTKPTIIHQEKNSQNIIGDIQFDQVNYTYPTMDTPTLHRISFHLPHSKTLGILGSTGSGKSTIGQLMLRFMDPQSGKITIDQLNIKDLSLTQLRDEISYVPQDVFLFSDTIYNNIAFGAVNVSTHNVEMAARLTQLHDTIMQFPNGYQTMLGERGINLSGGQKQRLAIARAFIKKSKILILDDCLSAVDTQTEKYILENLKKIRQNTTTIIITQRISSIIDADQIIVLTDGHIIQQGTHKELLKDPNGFYYQQYSSLIAN